MKQITIARRELPYEIAEEMKTLRTNLQFCGEDVHVIMFTSCVGGEGKSTTTLELARSFAELGKRVLLIDADLRKSVLKDKIKAGHVTLGMTNFLVGQCKADEAVYQTEMQGVHVAPSGPVPPNPSCAANFGAVRWPSPATARPWANALVITPGPSTA